jgi:hypothetical protein
MKKGTIKVFEAGWANFLYSTKIMMLNNIFIKRKAILTFENIILLGLSMACLPKKNIIMVMVKKSIKLSQPKSEYDFRTGKNWESKNRIPIVKSDTEPKSL